MARTTALLTAYALALASVPAPTLALDLDPTDPTSIASTAGTIAAGLMANYYDAASTAGDFTQPQPWFWWLSGSGWNAVLDYTILTNDTAYEAQLRAALTENLGAGYDFAPAAQAGWEANDDQMYWLYGALTALEYGVGDLQPCEGAGAGAAGTCANSWLSVATNAFAVFVARWDGAAATCGGGLKWQYDPSANGYTYKNSVTNGGFFQTAARLARLTGNATYAEWAGRIWDWSAAVGLMGPEFDVIDGASDGGADNCTTFDSTRWSYNAATYLHGAANMYAYTGASGWAPDADQAALWEGRVQGVLAAANRTFFSPPAGNATGVMYEPKCEPASSCNIDQTSFKSSLARWLGKTAVLVPSAAETALSLLATSARAAAASCTTVAASTSGAAAQLACGRRWWNADGFDGYSDFGTMLSALEVVQSLLVTSAPGLVTMASS